jgi:DNA-binding transcriptional MerR regulator
VTDAMTIDELAAEAGTTTRHVRSLQTVGLLPRPALRARTGLYGPGHLTRLAAVLRLQDQGFSLRSLSVLFAADDRGESLASVLGTAQPDHGSTPSDAGHLDGADAGHLDGTVGAGDPDGAGAGDPDGAHGDSAELYGFEVLESRQDWSRKPLLWIVPTTMWDEGMWDEGPVSGVA